MKGMDWGTHVYGERIDGGEKGCLSHGWYNPDDQWEREEGIGLVYPLKEPEAYVAEARDQGAKKEEIPRSDAFYVLPEYGREDYSREEDAAINLKAHVEDNLKPYANFGTEWVFTCSEAVRSTRAL